jgi:transcriptional regulator with XRE-family HTH domain
MDGTNGINGRIARRVRDLRRERRLTLDELAGRSGVSRSMISLVERGRGNPTAAVLDKLAAGLAVTMATLFDDGARAAPPSPRSRRAEQVEWRDPASGYLRRNLSPPGQPSPLQLVEVLFPPGRRVAYDSAPRDDGVHQQVWMIEGAMEVSVGDEKWRLAPGDCLAMRLDRPIAYRNPGRRPARYLVALSSSPARGAARRA